MDWYFSYLFKFLIDMFWKTWLFLHQYVKVFLSRFSVYYEIIKVNKRMILLLEFVWKQQGWMTFSIGMHTEKFLINFIEFIQKIQMICNSFNPFFLKSRSFNPILTTSIHPENIRKPPVLWEFEKVKKWNFGWKWIKLKS